jgi:tetratricopeptide (TPR) repeat protein
MKTTILALLLIVPSAHAAEFPPSSEHIADCENRWFLKESDEPSLRVLGFAYVDPTQGVTFEYDGDVALNEQGRLFRKTLGVEKARMIVRVSTNFEIACLSDAQVAALGLKAEPDMLKYYKDDRAPGPHNVAWASHYNQIGAPDAALRFLQVAIGAGYTSPRLSLELGFAHNALQHFDTAIEVLTPAVAANPENKELAAELGYAYLGKQDYRRAIELYELALSKFRPDETERKGEFAYNIAMAFKGLGDSKSEEEWRKNAAAWAENKGGGGN